MNNQLGIKGILAPLLPLFFLFLLILLYPSEAGEIYRNNYIVDGFALLTILLLIIIYIGKNGFDMFEPIYFITIIYAVLYFVTPIYDILTGEYLWFGYDLFKYGVKSTWIALTGYIVFYIFYIYKFKSKTDYNTTQINITKIESNNFAAKKTDLIIIVTLIIYAVSFAANVWYMLKSGYTSITYILTMGLIGGEATAAEKVDNIGFVSMLSFCLPTSTLLYWEYGRSKLLKTVLFVPMLMLQVTRGFRFFVVQIAVTFFAYYYIKKKKRPKVINIIIALIVLIIPVLLMTMFRDTVRAGEGAAVSSVSGDSIKEAFDQAFWDNLRIYKNFYGMVNAIPKKFSFVYGRQMIVGTIVMAIPRIIWPGKISTGAGVGLVQIIGRNLIGTGQAYPNIGEYYFALGIVGVIVFMALYGWWAKKLKTKYMSVSAGGINNILFSVLLGANLQLIIRGYTPSNFWYLVFSILPILIIKMIVKEGK